MPTIPAFNPSLYNWTDPTNPQPVAQQPAGLQGFAAHIANPANIQALAPSLAPVQSIKPQPQPDFFNPKSNLLAPTQPQMPAQMQAQPQGLPPTTGAFNAPDPQAAAMQAKTDADRAKLTSLQQSGAGLNRIQNKPLRVLARVGDIAGSILAPGVSAQLPGTTLHNRVLQNQQGNIVNQDVEAQQQANAARQQLLQNQDTQAQIAQRQAQTAQIPILTRAKQMQAQQMGAQHGLRPTFDQNGNQTGWESDPDSPVTQKVQAQNDYFSAREELANAQAALANAKNDPNSAAYKQAQQRIQTATINANTAIGKLGLARDNYNLKAFGTDSTGNAAAGALQNEDGRTVGTAFNKNVMPTGAERTKKDLANSADEQLADLKAIVQRNPTMFGPGYGQSSEFKKWIGGQSPDAQRFLAARTIAGDHLAGVFGGRSEAALSALDNAIGQFKDNPQAALAGIDQLSKANKSFIKAGTVPRAGGALGTGNPKQETRVYQGHTYVKGKNGWQLQGQ